jgi:hypothetical protein
MDKHQNAMTLTKTNQLEKTAVHETPNTRKSTEKYEFCININIQI